MSEVTKYFKQAIIRWLDKEKANDELFADQVKASGKNVEGCCFPELKKIGDELIRKELLDFCKNRAEKYSNDPKYNNISAWIAWLERQGERKTPQWMIDFLDNYRRKIGYSLDHDEARDVDSKILCIKKWLEKQGEQKPIDTCDSSTINGKEFPASEKRDFGYFSESTDKVEPKFKVKYASSEYNVLEVRDIAGVTFYGIEDEPNHIDYVLPNNCEIVSEHKPAWSEEDETSLVRALAFIKNTSLKDVDEIKESVITWITSLKGRVQPQPRQELSEEDKRIIDNLISQLGNLYVRKLIKKSTKDRYVNWLKSLRHQSQWKPSKQQIEALDFAVDCIVWEEFCIKRKVLKGLLEQLRKL